MPGAFSFEQLEEVRPPEPPADLDSMPDPAALAAAAHAQGLEAGHRDGLAAVRAELEPAAAAIGEALSQIQELRARAIDAVEREAVELALEIAEKVVVGAIEVQPERVLDAVRGALRRLVDRERVVIAVNAQDLDLVRAGAETLVETLGGIEHLEIQEDRRVPRGGAIVRTEVGEIDATIAAKLDSARRALETELRR